MDEPQESTNQLIVAMAIVAVLGLIGLGLIVAGIITKQWSDFGLGIGSIIGALATALNTPSGISKVIAAAKKPSDP